MPKKNSKKQVQPLIETQNSKHSVDQAIKETFNNLGKRFVLVSRMRIKSWQSLIIIAFITGVFGALIWAVSQEEVGKIYTAGELKNISNQASVTFEDSQGNKYGPVKSNITTTQVKEKTPEKKPIKIKFTIEGKKDYQADKIIIIVFTLNTDNVVYQTTGSSDTNGKIAKDIDLTNLPIGTYDFKIKVPYCLTKKIKNISWPTTEELNFDKCFAGNLQNQDDVINSLDWSILNEKWGTNDAVADINGDGIVNTLDWSLMNKNWGKTSD